MAERDIAWLLRRLSLCPKRRGLRSYGPMVRPDGSSESLAAFARKSAPRHGFRVLPDGGLGCAFEGQPPRKFFLHEGASDGPGTVTRKVVADLTRA